MDEKGNDLSNRKRTMNQDLPHRTSGHKRIDKAGGWTLESCLKVKTRYHTALAEKLKSQVEGEDTLEHIWERIPTSGHVERVGESRRGYYGPNPTWNEGRADHWGGGGLRKFCVTGWTGSRTPRTVRYGGWVWKRPWVIRPPNERKPSNESWVSWYILFE